MRHTSFRRCFVYALCAVFFFSSFSFAGVLPAEEQKLQQAALLLNQWREQQNWAMRLIKDIRLSQDAKKRRNEAVVVRKCLAKIHAETKKYKLSEEVLVYRVDQCLSRYKKAKQISGAVAVGGAGSALALHFLLRTEWFFNLAIENNLSLTGLMWGQRLACGAAAAGSIAWLCFRALPAESGLVPGGYNFLTKLRTDPDLFVQDPYNARKLLASSFNQDGSVSRYLDDYLYFLQQIQTPAFVLSLPDIQDEYLAWAQVHGASLDRPDMVKYLQIASKYPLSARAEQLRQIQRARTLRAVQEAAREGALRPLGAM